MAAREKNADTGKPGYNSGTRCREPKLVDETPGVSMDQQEADQAVEMLLKGSSGSFPWARISLRVGVG